MKRTIEKIVDYARIVAEPNTIILFGSAANGMVTVYSDIDLLLIVDNNLLNEQNITARIANFAREISLKVDVIIRTNAQIHEEILQPNSFIKSILVHGKKMYEKS